MPWTNSVTTHSANPVSAARRRNEPMRLILPREQRRQSPGQLGRRPQQIDVHDPAVTVACGGAQRGDPLTDVADGARLQKLVRRAEIRSPPDSGVGRAVSERTVP